MSNNMTTEVNKIIREMIRQGWRVEKGRHWRLYPLDKTKKPVTIGISPSDKRALENIIHDLRRAGARI